MEKRISFPNSTKTIFTTKLEEGGGKKKEKLKLVHNTRKGKEHLPDEWRWPRRRGTVVEGADGSKDDGVNPFFPSTNK